MRSPSSHSSIGGASGLAWPSIGLWSKKPNGSPALAASAKPSYIDLLGVAAEALGGRSRSSAAASITSIGALVCTIAVQHAADGVGDAEQRGAARRGLHVAQLLDRAPPSPATRACSADAVRRSRHDGVLQLDDERARGPTAACPCGRCGR